MATNIKQNNQWINLIKKRKLKFFVKNCTTNLNKEKRIGHEIAWWTRVGRRRAGEHRIRHRPCPALVPPLIPLSHQQQNARLTSQKFKKKKKRKKTRDSRLQSVSKREANPRRRSRWPRSPPRRLGSPGAPPAKRLSDGRRGRWWSKRWRGRRTRGGAPTRRERWRSLIGEFDPISDSKLPSRSPPCCFWASPRRFLSFLESCQIHPHIFLGEPLFLCEPGSLKHVSIFLILLIMKIY